MKPTQELPWKVYLREQIRDVLSARDLLAQNSGAPEVIEAIKRAYPQVKKMDVFERAPTSWSSVLGTNPGYEVRPPVEKLELLCLVLQGKLRQAESPQNVNALLEPLRAAYEENGCRMMPRVELLIPPSIDALVIEHRVSQAVDYADAEITDDVLVQVVRARREELLNGTRSPTTSRFFYLTWDAAVKTQKDLDKRGEKLLVLQGWSMVTGPKFCLLRRGGRHPSGVTTVTEHMGRYAGDDRKKEEMRFIGEGLETSTVVCIRRTTAMESFKHLFDDLKEGNHLKRHHKLYDVSIMTTLIELRRKGLMSDRWMVVGGPSTYWGAQSEDVEVFHATEHDARKIANDDQDAHCVIATTSRYLDDIDPQGKRVARYLQEIGTSLKDHFNRGEARARTAFREKLADAIEKRYLRIVDEPLYMEHDDVKNFINTGMELRIAETCSFVPVDEYRPAPRRSLDELEETRAIVPREPPAISPTGKTGGTAPRQPRR